MKRLGRALRVEARRPLEALHLDHQRQPVARKIHPTAIAAKPGLEPQWKQRSRCWHHGALARTRPPMLVLEACVQLDGPVAGLLAVQLHELQAPDGFHLE